MHKEMYWAFFIFPRNPAFEQTAFVITRQNFIPMESNSLILSF